MCKPSGCGKNRALNFEFSNLSAQICPPWNRLGKFQQLFRASSSHSHHCHRIFSPTACVWNSTEMGEIFFSPFFLNPKHHQQKSHWILLTSGLKTSIHRGPRNPNSVECNKHVDRDKKSERKWDCTKFKFLSLRRWNDESSMQGGIGIWGGKCRIIASAMSDFMRREISCEYEAWVFLSLCLDFVRPLKSPYICTREAEAYGFS